MVLPMNFKKSEYSETHKTKTEISNKINSDVNNYIENEKIIDCNPHFSEINFVKKERIKNQPMKSDCQINEKINKKQPMIRNINKTCKLDDIQIQSNELKNEELQQIEEELVELDAEYLFKLKIIKNEAKEKKNFWNK